MTVAFLGSPGGLHLGAGAQDFLKQLPAGTQVIFPHGENLADQLNVAMTSAVDDPVVFFLATGEPFPHCIELTIHAHRDRGWDVFSAPIDLIDDEQRLVRRVPAGLGSASRILFQGEDVPLPHGFSLTKGALGKVGPFRGDDAETVLEWSLRAEEAGCQIGELDMPLGALLFSEPTGLAPGRDRFARMLKLLLPSQDPPNQALLRSALAGPLDVKVLLNLRANWEPNQTGGLIPAMLDDRILELEPSRWRSLWTVPRAKSKRLDSLEKLAPQEGGRRTSGQPKVAVPGFPLVTVVTPTFNAEKYLGRCLLSVLNQTYPNVESIVVDGGSTDRTKVILEEFGDQIDFWQSEKDSGVYDAMNKGLTLATGEIIVILNADDFFSPTAIARSVRSLLYTKADYSIGECLFLTDEETEFSRQPPALVDASSLFNYSTACHQSFFVRREAYALVGPYDPVFRIAADYKFRNRLLLAGLKHAVVPGVLVYCSMGGLSTRPENRTRCLEEVYRIVGQTTQVSSPEEAEFLVQLATRGMIPQAAIAKYSYLADKHAFSSDLRSSFEKRLFPAVVEQIQNSKPPLPKFFHDFKQIVKKMGLFRNPGSSHKEVISD